MSFADSSDISRANISQTYEIRVVRNFVFIEKFLEFRGSHKNAGTFFARFVYAWSRAVQGRSVACPGAAARGTTSASFATHISDL